jgi:uracil-DNA glycosylase family 4
MEESSISIATALRDRLETDRLLGVQALPIVFRPRPIKRPPQQVKQPPRPAVRPEEIQQRVLQLAVLDNDEVSICTRCGLHATRNKTVFGVGSPAARIVFVGEAPGADEDASGIPFVGRAGELLTAMIEKGMGLKRDDVFICNVLKCRPPNNRTPAPDEIHSCYDYLLRQIQTIQPEVIVALGAPAAQTLLRTKDGIGRLRARWHEFYPSGATGVGPSIPVMPTFHPAYLLRSPGEKGKAWEDLKLVMQKLGISIPNRG